MSKCKDCEDRGFTWISADSGPKEVLCHCIVGQRILDWRNKTEARLRWDMVGRMWSHHVSWEQEDGVLHENKLTIGTLHLVGSTKYFGGTVLYSKEYGGYIPGTGLYYDSLEEARKDIYKMYPPS